MWTNQQVEWLKHNYSLVGQKASAQYLNKSLPSIRMKTFRLGLRQDRNSEFFQDWQKRAAISKIGKKRPEQAFVMKKTHAEGKFLRTPEQNRILGEKTRIRFKEKGHPKGMLGKTHSEDFKKRMSEKVKAAWADPNYACNQDAWRQANSDRMSKLQTDGKMRQGYSRGKQGKREDLNGLYVRSAWEANYARYLNFLVKNNSIYKWEYEVDTFWFEQIKRGTRSYTPDFKIWEKEDSEPYYIEVKGWMDKSKTKLKRMAKYHPLVKIVLVEKKEYDAIKRTVRMLIPNWE